MTTATSTVARRSRSTPASWITSRDYAINQAWCTAVSMACDLLAWLRLLALTGALAKAEPQPCATGYSTPPDAIVRGQRRRRLKIPETWPWAHDLHRAFTMILALQPP